MSAVDQRKLGKSLVPDDLVQLQLRRNGTVETLHITGELDVSTVPAFLRSVSDSLDGQGAEFRIDVSGLTFTDSTGAQAMLRVHRRVERLGRRAVFVSPTRPVRRVLEVLGFDKIFNIES